MTRVTADKDEGIKILADHPDTKDRVVAINAISPKGAATPLLGAADWAALKQICAPSPASATAPAGGQRSGWRDDSGSRRDRFGKRSRSGKREKSGRRDTRGKQMKAKE